MRVFLFCILLSLPFFAQVLKPSYSLKNDAITSRDLFSQAPLFPIASFSDRFEFEIPSQALEKLFKEHHFLLEKSPYAQIKFIFTPPFEAKKAKEEIKQAFLKLFVSFNPEITKISLKPLGEIKGKEMRVLGAKIEEKSFKKKKFSLMLEVLLDGKQGFLPFLCEIDASLEVFVALEDIKASQDLNAQNVAKKRITFESFSTLPALEEQIYTSASRSFISKGSMIFTSKLKPQILVKRGEWIEASLKEENITIQIRLQAMQNATLGQEINAKNPESQKIIRVKITGRGKGVVL